MAGGPANETPAPFILDIGGEGRNPDAFNLNLHRCRTLGPRRGEPIPRLIVGRADAIPLADRSVQCVIVERTPLGSRALAEIARVAAPGGTVVLAHVPLPDRDRHAAARRALPGKATQRMRRIGGQRVLETRILLTVERLDQGPR